MGDDLQAGGFRGKVIAATTGKYAVTSYINIIAAGVEEGRYTPAECREVREVVMEQIRTTTNKRALRAWCALFVLLERNDAKKVDQLIAASNVEHGDEERVLDVGVADKFHKWIKNAAPEEPT